MYDSIHRRRASVGGMHGLFLAISVVVLGGGRVSPMRSAIRTVEKT
jgi:hypothetical protein